MPCKNRLRPEIISSGEEKAQQQSSQCVKYLLEEGKTTTLLSGAPWKDKRQQAKNWNKGDC